jgi:hypothetical protein
MAESPQLPDRIQRDLEDALRQGGVDKLPNQPRPRRAPRRLRLPDPRPRNPGQLVLMGVVCFIVGFFFMRATPYFSYLVMASITCVVVAILTYYIQPGGVAPKYWRGRYLDVPSGRWQERLYRIIYRQS